jgi:glyoxylase-like metal-dependent hydrolase (beta-lactamase superfamily II)
MYHTLDLNFLGYNEAIASFLIESTEGPILIESGPYSTFGHLEKALNSKGYTPSDVKHVLLSHIHFDHAGAAWAFAKTGAKIYLHPFGAGHMHDPSKLVASATMIYGDQMDVLWGKMEGIPLENLKEMAHEEKLTIGEHTFTALHTPGHAKHHIAWELGRTVFTGDVAGVKIGNGPVVPPCPPPDINIEDWNTSIDLILSRNPERLVLTHFDARENVKEHMAQLKAILNDWAEWIKTKVDAGLTAEAITPLFMEYTNAQLKKHGVSAEGLKQYEAANPAWMSVAGLMRYWKKKEVN